MRRIRSNTITEACDMAISALQDLPIHFGRCWDCVSFIAEGEKCKWDLLTGEDGYCHHFLEKYGELNCITESPNDVIEKNDEVIKSVRCKDCEWFDNCESFVTPPCTKQTEPSDFIRQETIKELGDWLEQMIQHGVPSHSAKRKALANAIALLSMDTHEIHTETHECVKETHDSDLISREDLLKKAEKGNITKYSTNSVNIITTDVVTVENIKKAPSADTPTTEVKKPTNTPTDLISRADAVAYPLGFDHYDKENGSREFICGVESYREYIQHLPSVSVESKATENIYDCDLISRADIVYHKQLEPMGNGQYEEVEVAYKSDIDGIPSVSAERVGEWELCKDIDGEYGICSVCGNDADFSHYGKPYHYCPNCGARMENKK